MVYGNGLPYGNGISTQTSNCDDVRECIAPDMESIFNQIGSIDDGVVQALDRTEELRQKFNDFQNAVPLDAQDIRQIIENMNIEGGAGGGLTEDQVDTMIDDAIDNEIMPMVDAKIEDALGNGNGTGRKKNANERRSTRRSRRSYVRRGSSGAGGGGTRGSSAWSAGNEITVGGGNSGIMLTIAAGCLILAIYLYVK